VVDDALRDPARWVDHAATRTDDFAEAPHNAYPGVELRLAEAEHAPLADFFDRHVRGLLGGRRTLRSYSRLSLVTRPAHSLQPLQCIPHVDRLRSVNAERIAACVLYLFEDESLGGTSFFRPRRPLPDVLRLLQDASQLDAGDFADRHGIAPGYPGDSAWFERVLTVPPRFNRLVFYDGGLFHSGHIPRPDQISRDPRRGRLTLNGFFACRSRLG
jgi:hypothetical protein